MTGTVPGAVIHSAALADGDGGSGWVRIAAGVVTHRGAAEGWRAHAAPDDEVIDARGAVLAPGFLDIHCHGALGVAFDDPDADDAALLDAIGHHRAHGVTHVVLSLVSAPLPVLTARLAALADFARRHPVVAGLHLEGPFLAHTHRGAHDPRALRALDPASVDALLAAAEGALAQLTIAPELPGGLDAVARLVDAGVTPAVGHTGCDYDTARAAFDAGARILTHAFNGMPGIHHRAPGPVAAAAQAGVVLELIADGVHVDPRVLSLVAQLAPGRVALVSDAISATGCGDGLYRLGGMDVRVTAGRASLVDGDSIAGSTGALDAAMRTAVAAGWSVLAAIAAVTSVPARAIDRPDLGHLGVGARGGAVLLDARLRVSRVWSGS